MCRLGACDAFGDQPGHARAGIEARAAGPARVDDGTDVLDGQRGFRDGGGEHDLAGAGLRHGGDGGALGGEIHRTEERADGAGGGQALCQQGFHASDLTLAGQEDQHAAFGFGNGPGDQIGAGVFQPGGLGQGRLQPAQIDGKAAPPGGDDGRAFAHEGSDGFGIQRRGHGQQDQVVTQRPGDFKAEGQSQIGIERAFVEFVEDHRADARQPRIGLDHPGQDAFGHHLDPGFRAGLAVAPDAVAHGLAYGFAQGIRHTLGCGAGGKAAGFQHEDTARGQPRLQHRQRDDGGFPGTGRGLQDRAAMVAQGRDQRIKDIMDRKGGLHRRLIGDFARPVHRLTGQAQPAKA